MSAPLRSCDVLVIGAGPAGSSAARFAAAEGANVVFVERKEEVGAPVQCAEHVPLPTLAYLPRPEEVIVQRVRAMRTDLPGEPPNVLACPGAIVDRRRFDRQLADEAERSGATLLTSTHALGMETSHDRARVWLARGDERFEVEAKVVIGADGPRSRVREWTGGGVNRFVNTAQLRMPLREPLDTADCLFRRWLPGGYGWVFPRGEWANVGVGVDRAHDARPVEGLNRLIDELLAAGVVEDHRKDRTGGLLPVGGMVTLRRGRVLLAGDAAGQCHPLTGAGIHNAVICGEAAGRAAGEATQASDLELLEEYVEEAQDLVGPSLAHARARRTEQDGIWNLPDAEWRRGIRRSWTAYEEYMREERA